MNSIGNAKHALYCIRPQYFDRAEEIERALTKGGLQISQHVTTWLTEQDLVALYANESPSRYMDATKFYMTRGFCQIGIVQGDNAVQRLVEVTGASHIPSENESGTIRAMFGSSLPVVFEDTPYYLNPIHRTKDEREAETSANYFLSHLVSRPTERIIADMMWQLHSDRHLLCVYDHHITKVVEISEELRQEFGGNRDVVRLASWLHDIAALESGTKENHHLAGGEKADQVLRLLRCDDDVIKNVRHCIECHSGSAPLRSATIEAEIVRSADGIANLRNPPLLYYFAFARKGLDFATGLASIKSKVEKSFAKISDFAKHRARDDYDRWMNILS